MTPTVVELVGAVPATVELSDEAEEAGVEIASADSAEIEIIPTGARGPQGPAFGDDLPDFTLVFDNQLV